MYRAHNTGNACIMLYTVFFVLFVVTITALICEGSHIPDRYSLMYKSCMFSLLLICFSHEGQAGPLLAGVPFWRTDCAAGFLH